MVVRVKIPEEISHLKTRQAIARGKIFQVPQGIVRIDIFEKGWGTHGWQVRPPKYHEDQRTKLFSDRVDFSDKGPAHSLRRALAYMAQNPPTPHVRQYPGKSEVTAQPEKLSTGATSIASGFHGIRLVLKHRKNRSFQEIYVEASNIEKGKASKRFYCGTLETATEDRVAAALSKALEARQRMKTELLQIRQAQANKSLERALQRDLKRAQQGQGLKG